MKEVFSDSGIEISDLNDYENVPEIIEDSDTFEGNALIKAHKIYNEFNTLVIADDTGLMVDQLNGEPGVYSARYAGENCSYDDNNNKMLDELKNFPKPHNAKFVCCAVFYDGNNTIICNGEMPGEIISEKRGNHGFGYDPIFKPLGSDFTLAEMSIDYKNKISHRAAAFNVLKNEIMKYLKTNEKD